MLIEPSLIKLQRQHENQYQQIIYCISPNHSSKCICFIFRSWTSLPSLYYPRTQHACGKVMHNNTYYVVIFFGNMDYFPRGSSDFFNLKNGAWEGMPYPDPYIGPGTFWTVGGFLLKPSDESNCNAMVISSDQKKIYVCR